MNLKISELEFRVDQLETVIAEMGPSIRELIEGQKSILSMLEALTLRMRELGFNVEEVFRLISEARDMLEDERIRVQGKS